MKESKKKNSTRTKTKCSRLDPKVKVRSEVTGIIIRRYTFKKIYKTRSLEMTSTLKTKA